MSEFFVYTQNNTNGYILENEHIAGIVILECRTEQAADNRAERLGLFRLPYCECCGPRFRRHSAEEYHTLDAAIWGHVSARRPRVILYPIGCDIPQVVAG